MLHTKGRNGCQSEKECFGTHPNCRPLGVHGEPAGGPAGGAQIQNQDSKKRNGKNANPLCPQLQKNGCHFGKSTKLFGSNALSQGFHRPNAGLCKHPPVLGLGQKYLHPRGPQGRGKNVGYSNWPVEGKAFFTKNSSQGFTFRQFRQSLGWNQHPNGGESPGILETKGWSSHKCERIGSGHLYHQKSGQAAGGGPPLCGQHHSLLVLEKRWEKVTPLECSHERVLAMVPAKTDFSERGVGSLRNGSGRQLVKASAGQGGLHPGPRPLQKVERALGWSYHTPSGPLCQPRQLPAATTRGQGPPLGGLFHQRLRVLPETIHRELSKPPLDHHRSVVGKVAKQPSF